MLTKIACIIFFIIGFISTDIYLNNFDKETVERRTKERQIAEQEYLKKRKEESTPRLISSADGCKVYEFRPSPFERLKYFVKCENSTSTSTDNSYRNGKKYIDNQIEVN